jgi:hypothetical protein
MPYASISKNGNLSPTRASKPSQRIAVAQHKLVAAIPVSAGANVSEDGKTSRLRDLALANCHSSNLTWADRNAIWMPHAFGGFDESNIANKRKSMSDQIPIAAPCRQRTPAAVVDTCISLTKVQKSHLVRRRSTTSVRCARRERVNQVYCSLLKLNQSVPLYSANACAYGGFLGREPVTNIYIVFILAFVLFQAKPARY